VSRSYKHTPRVGEQKDKFFKRYANRRLRRKKISNRLQNKSYKKDFCYYDICDYEEVGISFDRYYSRCVKGWHEWGRNFNNSFPNKDEVYKEYMKYYIRK
jgi:hypothetical protein